MKELHIKLSEPETPQGPYQAEILPPPAGTEGFALPQNPIFQLALPDSFNGHALPDFQKDLLKLEQGQDNQLSSIGKYLFNFLFGPPDERNMLYDYWNECYDSERASTDAARGMRTVLHFVDGSMLAGVPWEFCNEDETAYFTLIETPPHTLIRSGWKGGGIGKLPVVPPPDSKTEPLRILVAICHNPDDDRLKGPEEALGIDRVLFSHLPWMVDLHIMVRPVLAELEKHCREWEPHILHFVGHGGEANGEPYLLYHEGEQAKGKQLFSGGLANLFEKMVPRLVVLNACRSGQEPDLSKIDARVNASYATRSFSKQLIRKGVPAVIAMQADITGEDAATLMRSFYHELANGYPIDLALARARHERFTAGGNDLRSNWSCFLPVLYLAEGILAENVLLLKKYDKRKDEPLVLPPDSVMDKYDNLPLSMSVKIHIGRENDELQLARQVLAPGPSSIILIHGIEDVGKSTMLYWLAEFCARRDQHFFYADFVRQPLDYWEALRLIRDGQLESKEVKGIRLNNHLQPNVIFNAFNYTLNYKCKPGYALSHPHKPGPDEEISDEAPAGNLTQRMAELGVARAEENPMETITNAFIEGLERAADPSLIIFLDHFEKMSPEIMEIMLNNLIGGISKIEGKSIHLVLAIQDHDSTRPWQESNTNLSLKQVSRFIQKNGNVIFDQPLKGFDYEKSRWLARIWARRYFLGCKHEKFQQMLEIALAQGMPVPEDKDVDSYVQKHINYDVRPVLPKRLVEDLLNEDNLLDWLARLVVNKVGHL